MGLKEDLAKAAGASGRAYTRADKAASRNTKSHVGTVADYVLSRDKKKGKATTKPKSTTKSTPKKNTTGYTPGGSGIGTREQRVNAPRPDWDYPENSSQVHGEEGPDQLQALLDQLLSQVGTDVGAAPSLQDYISAFQPARQNALGYQQAATGKIQQGTQDLLASMAASNQFANQDRQQVAAATKAQTQGIQGDQTKAALLAAQDLQRQGVSSAPLEAQAQQLGGQLQSTVATSDAFAAKLAQLGANEQASRDASAKTMGQGAVGQLGINTGKTLSAIDLSEADARRQFAQDSSQYAQRQSAAKSNDLQTRFQLAQQFADLDASTQVDPTTAVRQAHKAHAGLFDLLDQGKDPSEARMEFAVLLAEEKRKPREEQDVAKIAQLQDGQKALQEWEKAVRPDAKAEAKKKQVATLAKYLQPH